MNRRLKWRGMIWRGELAAAFVSKDDNAAGMIAQSLGLVEVEPQVVEENQTAQLMEDIRLSDHSAAVPGSTSGDPVNLEDARFWQPFRYEARSTIELPPQQDARLRWTSPPRSPPTVIPIAPKSVVHPRLRTAVSGLSAGRGLDMQRIVGSLARAELLQELPRKRLRRWGRQILVVLDRNDRLVPFFADQERLCQQLELLTPDGAIRQLFAGDPDDDFVFVDGTGNLASWTFDTPVRVVLLSDLGVLQSANNLRLCRRWYEWGRRLVGQGFSLVALVPFPVHVAGSDLRRVFSMVSWQRSARDYVHDELRRSQLVDQLLAAVSPAVRLEPGLLRAIRTLLPEAIDASLESDFWQHPVVTSPHVDAATLDRRAMEKRYCPAFAGLPRKQRARILSTLRSWRFDFSNSPEVWFQEILNLDSDSQSIIEEQFPGDLQDAFSGIHHLANQAKQKGKSRYLRMLREYGGRAADWLSERARQDIRIRQAVHDLWDAAPRMGHRDLGGLDPALLGGTGEPVCVAVTQRGNEFQFAVGQRDATSFVVPLWTRNGWIDLTSFGLDRDSFWKSGKPPAWASDWGRDQYGAWAEFEIHGEAESLVRQRLRWISAGTFLMGSPKSERERDSDEGEHEVTLTRGYWLFDTQVTQGLWHPVMGANPSSFTGDRHPVDNVSWEDTQGFLTRLNERLGESHFVLPTEAQWEYACRADSRTPYHFGSQCNGTQANCDGNYPYGTKAKGPYVGRTTPVGSYAANSWGLFDMHGNVWEWCQDWYGESTTGAQVDPQGPHQGHYRVLRGGGWFNLARYARSAYRSHRRPGFRFYYFGFRCAQVQGAVEPAEEDGGRQAERRPPPTNGGEAAAFKIEADACAPTPIPTGSVAIIRSDVDSLELRKIAKPDWATAIGRDRYGLWAEFTVNGTTEKKSARTQRTKTAVVQRMRWIPPGRFLMGSAGNDEQAFDDEKPQHEVILRHGYWLFDTPVIQELWEAVMKKNPSRFQGPRRPVEQVSWEDCQTFLGKINDTAPDLNLSLTTEAEWEYACRAGTVTRYAFGDEITLAQANYYEKGREATMTTDVGIFAPNAWGLFDMHGNVWEWCHDWYAKYGVDPLVNPQGPDTGPFRVLRGGCWYDYARFARSASRLHFEPGIRSSGIGFRCAQVHPSSRERERTSEGAGQSRDATPDLSE